MINASIALFLNPNFNSPRSISSRAFQGVTVAFLTSELAIFFAIFSQFLQEGHLLQEKILIASTAGAIDALELPDGCGSNTYRCCQTNGGGREIYQLIIGTDTHYLGNEYFVTI